VLHPGELYGLSPGDWARIEGVSSDQLDEIQRQMEGSKSPKPSALLHGLRLPGVSASMAKRLIEEIGSIDSLQETKPKRLQEIDGIDEAMAFEVYRWFRDSVNKQALKMLDQYGFNFTD
jgi:NAD-dependent DNA ligase